jgi:hypothetical protein
MGTGWNRRRKGQRVKGEKKTKREDEHEGENKQEGSDTL